MIYNNLGTSGGATKFFLPGSSNGLVRADFAVHMKKPRVYSLAESPIIAAFNTLYLCCYALTMLDFMEIGI